MEESIDEEPDQESYNDVVILAHEMNDSMHLFFKAFFIFLFDPQTQLIRMLTIKEFHADINVFDVC